MQKLCAVKASQGSMALLKASTLSDSSVEKMAAHHAGKIGIQQEVVSTYQESLKCSKGVMDRMDLSTM